MTAGATKSLNIIIPSYNDSRILDAIASVRAFDDADDVAILIIDGGSRPELVSRIAACLTPDDLLISERDKGIFDALNKGLAASQARYIGWIGSDDSFTGLVTAREVIRHLEAADLFVAGTAHVRGQSVVRVTHSWSSRHRVLQRILNNPHFSTFGRSDLLKSERFELDLRGADIAYFLRIFARRPVVRTSSKIATFMEVGGYSNAGYKTTLKMHAELFRIHRLYMPAAAAGLALAAKLGFKSLNTVYYRLVRADKRSVGCPIHSAV